MTEDLRQVTLQFAEALCGAPEVQAYTAARLEMENDIATQDLLERFHCKRMEYQRKQKDGSLTEGDIAALRQLQNEMRNDSRLATWGQAQQTVFDFAQGVGERLSERLGFDFGAFAAPASSGCCG